MRIISKSHEIIEDPLKNNQDSMECHGFQVLSTLLMSLVPESPRMPGLSDVCLVGMLSMRATGAWHKISSKSPSGQGFLASGSYIYTCILYIYKLSQTFANVF